MSAALIESNFGDPGNLEVVVRMRPPVVDATGGDYLVHLWRDSGTSRWSAPQQILVDGSPIDGVTGDPA